MKWIPADETPDQDGRYITNIGEVEFRDGLWRNGKFRDSENSKVHKWLDESDESEEQSLSTPDAIDLLKEYEQWEADLISDNQMWWPNVPKDRISGKTYDKMMELQAKRNKILKAFPIEVEGGKNIEDFASIIEELEKTSDYNPREDYGRAI